MRFYIHSAFVIAVILAGSNVVPLHAQEIAAPYTPKEGDRWQFKGTTKDAFANSSAFLNGVYELVYTGGSLEVFQVDGDQKLSVGGSGPDELKRMIRTDEREYLKFPLAVGKKWTGTYTQRSGSRSSTRNMEYVVTGLNGDHFEISGVGTVSTGAGGVVTQNRIFFYSPEDKAIVKFHYDSAVGETGAKVDIELIKFIPGK